MKKTFILAIVVVFLFNFIFTNFVYADDVTSDDSAISYSEESFNTLTEEGEVSLTEDSESEEVSISTSSTGSITGTMTSMLSKVYSIVPYLLSRMVNRGGFYYTESDYSAENVYWFSVCSLVFGEYLLFNVNVYQTNESLNPEIEATEISNTMDAIKEHIVSWFEILRLVAIALLVVLIIFSGIMLAVSTLAEDKARYKEILKTWFIGLAFLYFLPYIIVFINTISDYILNILWDIRITLEKAGYSSFETELFKECLDGSMNFGGLKAFAYFVEFVALSVMEIKFLIKYLWRSFNVFLLVLLSPIIAVMHVFSKIKGGQGLIKGWVSQYVMNVTMQPLHALIYLIFMFTASEIASRAPLLAVVFIWALSRGEKILKVILQLDYGKISTLFSKS